MNDVYVLSWHPYEGFSKVLGAYSTREKAREGFRKALESRYNDKDELIEKYGYEEADGYYDIHERTFEQCVDDLEYETGYHRLAITKLEVA